MNPTTEHFSGPPRILIVDDNNAIHDDFRKVLAAAGSNRAGLDDLEAALFETPAPTGAKLAFELVSAFQGKDAYDLVVAARAAGRPFAIAFVDMRMPPGWDGLETIENIWKVDPEIQIVICSAYSDHSWGDLRTRLGDRDALLILKKPFDTVEVVQCAHALTTKWDLARDARIQLAQLQSVVAMRTAELEQAKQQIAAQLAAKERLEAELRVAQKLEALGQLAAGIAHEINTPIQYVSDSLTFIREGSSDLVRLTNELAKAVEPYRTTSPELGALVDQLTEATDLSYLSDRIPNAVECVQEGVARVASIVCAMKEFVHPGSDDAQLCDVNHALETTLRVTRNTYRYVAEVETDLGAIPRAVCYPAALNQVFLNLIVNAAHAMEDCPRTRHVLRIATRLDGDELVVSISDTGSGVPEAIRDRIFDAFFTTKRVGRGTGQGLAIARSIVVDRHHGTLTFESTPDRGTTFYVRIPIAGPKLTA